MVRRALPHMPLFPSTASASSRTLCFLNRRWHRLRCGEANPWASVSRTPGLQVPPEREALSVLHCGHRCSRRPVKRLPGASTLTQRVTWTWPGYCVLDWLAESSGDQGVAMGQADDQGRDSVRCRAEIWRRPAKFKLRCFCRTTSMSLAALSYFLQWFLLHTC